MTGDDSAGVEHCADLVRKGDPERFFVTRAVASAAQARLWPLYALNLEIGRAAWASKEPMMAAMRLQWWHDVLERLGQGVPEPGHPVLAACGFLLGDTEGVAIAQRIVAARHWDLERQAFADDAVLWDHLAATGGALMWLAARALGAPATAAAVVQDYGTATALAGWLQAVPDLEARNRLPLVDGRPEGVAGLARDGLARLAAARQQRRRVPRRALPALLAGVSAGPLLARAAADPALVADGQLHPDPVQLRRQLAWAAISGRW